MSPLHSHSRQSEAVKVNPASLCGVNHLPSTQCPQLASQVDAAEEEVAELGGDYLEEINALLSVLEAEKALGQMAVHLPE